VERRGNVSGVAISYIIVLIVFVIGVITCSINDGYYDVQITRFFSDLGHNTLNPDGKSEYMESIG